MQGQPLEADADVTALPHGTKVGVWVLKGCRGRGTYGTVYRAVREGDEQGRVVALKLATHPRDARFKREAELLRRGRHPSVPQLLDCGEWRHPNGFIYPFIVMSWVEGEGLYEWAARRNPNSRQVKELAETMERASEQEGREAEAPLFEWETVKRTEWPQEDLAAEEELGHRVRRRDREVVRVAAEADAARRAEAERQQAQALTRTAPRAEHGVPRERSWLGLLWLAAVMMLGTLVLWPRQKEPGSTHEELTVVQEATAEEKGDGGVIYVGDTAVVSFYVSMETPVDRGFALEAPPKPVPG